MEITKTVNGEVVILSLKGRLDTTTAPDLQDAVVPEINSGKNVRLDFAQLAYVSSAGLRVLLVAEKTANRENVWLTLVNVSADVKEVFDMTGFSEFLNIER
jgi:anti-anti-sigma factor